MEDLNLSSSRRRAPELTLGIQRRTRFSHAILARITTVIGTSITITKLFLSISRLTHNHQHIVDKATLTPSTSAPMCTIRTSISQLLLGSLTMHDRLTRQRTKSIIVNQRTTIDTQENLWTNSTILTSMSNSMIIIADLRIRNFDILITTILIRPHVSQRNSRHGIPGGRSATNFRSSTISFLSIIIRIQLVGNRTISIQHTRIIILNKECISPATIVHNTSAKIYISRSHTNSIISILNTSICITISLSNPDTVSLREAHSNSHGLVRRSSVVCTSLHRNGNSSRTIRLTSQSQDIARDRDRTSLSIVTRSRDSTITSTINSDSASFLRGIQLHRISRQRQRASRLTDNPRNLNRRSGTVRPLIVRLRSEGSLISTSYGRTRNTSKSKSRGTIVVPSGRLSSPSIGQRPSLRRSRSKGSLTNLPIRILSRSGTIRPLIVRLWSELSSIITSICTRSITTHFELSGIITAPSRTQSRAIIHQSTRLSRNSTDRSLTDHPSNRLGSGRTIRPSKVTLRSESNGISTSIRASHITNDVHLIWIIVTPSRRLGVTIIGKRTSLNRSRGRALANGPGNRLSIGGLIGPLIPLFRSKGSDIITRSSTTQSTTNGHSISIEVRPRRRLLTTIVGQRSSRARNSGDRNTTSIRIRLSGIISTTTATEFTILSHINQLIGCFFGRSKIQIDFIRSNLDKIKCSLICNIHRTLHKSNHSFLIS